MLLRYLTIGSLAAIGVFSFAKRDFVVDAFDWSTKPTPIEIPALDPVGRARQLHTEPPAIKALTFLPATDTRSVTLSPVLGGNDAPSVELTGVQRSSRGP